MRWKRAVILALCFACGGMQGWAQQTAPEPAAGDSILRARSEERQGELAAALRDYTRILAVEPDNLNAGLGLGRVHAQAGDLAGAETIFAAVIRQHPDSAEAHYSLGLVLLGVPEQAGRGSSAKKELETALQLRPDYPEAENLLGTTLLHEGDADGALLHLRKAAAEDPSSAEIHFQLGRALSVGDPRGGAEEFRKALALRGSYPAAQAALGEVLLNEKKPAEARACFEAALREDPDLESAHYGLARTWKEMGAMDAAAVEFHEAQALLQRSSDAVMSTHLSNAALDLAKQGKKADAVAEGRKAVALAPDNGAAVYNLGLLLADTGAYVPAVLEVRKAASLLPLNAAPRQALERLLSVAEAEQPSSEKTKLAEVARFPYGATNDSAEAHAAFARELLSENDAEGAAGELLRALRQHPARYDLRLQLAQVWLQMGQSSSAEMELRKVLLAEPQNRQARLALDKALARGK